MVSGYKSQESILQKLKIVKLNSMQEEASAAIQSEKDVILLSPTGTGKTLAFLLPIIAQLDPDCPNVQALIITPSRELAIQINEVCREMGSGFKSNAVYGGRSGSKDKIELKNTPAILIGTPGRLAAHLERELFSVDDLTTLVLDEFDKSLEIGFEEEMSYIISELPYLKKRILTSATNGVEIPDFVDLSEPITVNYLQDKIKQLTVKTVVSPSKNKLETLVDLLYHTGNESGIIFCNYKDTIREVSDYLNNNGVPHGCFYGGMEQVDRERTLLKFRNGTFQLLVATDLAARGIDVPDLKFIIHYQLPHKVEEFTHRNGRTARMNADGTAYVLHWDKENLPDFITTNVGGPHKDIQLETNLEDFKTDWQTLFISGGKKDKISKGDVAGLFFKQGNLERDELGVIEIKHDCSFVAVKASKAEATVQLLDNARLKKRKVRMRIV